MTRRPAPDEHAPFYGRYVGLVPTGDIRATLAAQVRDTADLLRGLPDATAHHRYAPEKWSVAELVQHVVDTERVFAFRALWFARGDTSPLPGFDENAWAAAASPRAFDALVEDLLSVRTATLALLDGLGADAWDCTGTASGHPMSVRAAAYVIAGHERHHVAILHERYL